MFAPNNTEYSPLVTVRDTAAVGSLPSVLVPSLLQ